MDNIGLWIGGYILLVNVYMYWLMGVDKQYAKKHKRRVPERHIFLCSALGGAIGTYLGMRAYRHKTQHRSFTIGIPLIIVVHILLVILIVGVLM